MNPTDFLGREIRPGDLIVYPWRRGSAMGLNKLSVIAGDAGLHRRLQQSRPPGEDHQPQERGGRRASADQAPGG